MTRESEANILFFNLFLDERRTECLAVDMIILLPLSPSLLPRLPAIYYLSHHHLLDSTGDLLEYHEFWAFLFLDMTSYFIFGLGGQILRP